MEKREKYYQEKKKRLAEIAKPSQLNQFIFSNQSHVLKTVGGFDYLEEEIEHDIQPWNSDITEYEVFLSP